MNFQNKISLDAALFASRVKCERPFVVKFLNGEEMAVRCGSCPACLLKRRVDWSYRLNAEASSRRCIYQFGFTLTYDSNYIPYETYTNLSEGRLTYDRSDTIVLKRGCSATSLISKQNVALLYYKDIQLMLKRFRKWLSKYDDRLFVRYFITGEYGTLDDKRTGRPHYHGLIFLCCKNVDDVEKLQKLYRYRILHHKGDNGKVQFSCEKCSQLVEIESRFLDFWKYATRRYDPIKCCYYGKDVHIFGQQWGNYLGKYVSKKDASAYCIGEKYIPSRSYCSRQNRKYGVDTLGFVFNNYELNYYSYYALDCISNGTNFAPYKISGGFKQYLPKSFNNRFIHKVLGVSQVLLNRYLAISNYLSRTPLHNQHITELGYAIPQRKRSRVYSVYKHKSDEVQVRYIIPLDKEEMVRCERYLNYKNACLQAYYDYITSPGRGYKNVVLNYNGSIFNSGFRFFSQSLLSSLNENRKLNISYCHEVRKKALDYKFHHEIKNRYVKN